MSKHKHQDARVTPRRQSEVKQLRFAIGLSAAELGGAGAPKSEVSIEMEQELEEARPLKMMSDPKDPSPKERSHTPPVPHVVPSPLPRWARTAVRPTSVPRARKPS